MKLVSLLPLLLLSSIVVPTASAAPTLKVTIDSAMESVLIEPGGRANVALKVTLEFKDYPCSPDTEAGVDLVPPVAPPEWFGADPHPDANTYKAPKETKPASLTIVVSEDAPGDASGKFRLQPVLHFPSQASCGNVEPEADAPEFSITVRTPPGPSSASVDATGNDGTDTPGPGLGSVLVVGLLAWLLGRRRT